MSDRSQFTITVPAGTDPDAVRKAAAEGIVRVFGSFAAPNAPMIGMGKPEPVTDLRRGRLRITDRMGPVDREYQVAVVVAGEVLATLPAVIGYRLFRTAAHEGHAPVLQVDMSALDAEVTFEGLRRPRA